MILFVCCFLRYLLLIHSPRVAVSSPVGLAQYFAANDGISAFNLQYIVSLLRDSEPIPFPFYFNGINYQANALWVDRADISIHFVSAEGDHWSLSLASGLRTGQLYAGIVFAPSHGGNASSDVAYRISFRGGSSTCLSLPLSSDLESWDITLFRDNSILIAIDSFPPSLPRNVVGLSLNGTVIVAPPISGGTSFVVFPLNSGGFNWTYKLAFQSDNLSMYKYVSLFSQRHHLHPPNTRCSRISSIPDYFCP
jgi:hypothetical protein